jgi:formamidopyrimidine-DNA glycosylase
MRTRAGALLKTVVAIMPELPEVEITRRRLQSALSNARIESVRVPGVVALKSFDPPIERLHGCQITEISRRGKILLIGFEELFLAIHLMSSGRVQLFDQPGSQRDRSLRACLGFSDGRELRLREFGTKQRAWVKLFKAQNAESALLDDNLVTLGPEAWPVPNYETFASLVSVPRYLHPLLRDQHVLAGIGRAWVDEILWHARLSAFRMGSDLKRDETEALHTALGSVLTNAIEHYELVISSRLPDKMPSALQVHGRQGHPCPRCGTELAAVFFKEHTTTYCPTEQTQGRILKDRRLSRLLL